MNTPLYNKTIVCVAGHFNPLHSGHLKMIDAAKELGDYLVVIVANDYQASLKRPKLFQSQMERSKIIGGLRNVDKVVVSVDETPEVTETIRMIRPDIFASGCEPTHPDAIKEAEACLEMGIETVFNVGGEKIKSSSAILNNYAS